MKKRPFESEGVWGGVYGRIKEEREGRNMIKMQT